MSADDSGKVTAYIGKHAQWTAQLQTMRRILGETELSETVKWGAPAWTLNGRIVVSIAGFRNHCALWFHQGVFLQDEGKKLVNAQQGTTRGLRQWRFETGDEVEPELLRAYVLEAIANEKAGKRIKPRKKTLVLPPELAAALKQDAELKKAFDALAPGRQREYADHVNSAKQERTRMARLQKITPMINAGAGLHDKYRNC